MESGHIVHFERMFLSNTRQTSSYTTMAGAMPERDSSNIGNMRKAVVGSTANICGKVIGSLA
jgi:hypothetical protein